MGRGVDRVVEVGAGAGGDVEVDVGVDVGVEVGVDEVEGFGRVDEDEDEDEEEEDVLDVGGIVLVVSRTGPSSTGGGSAGAAATRKPRKTSRGTLSIAMSSMPSRPMRQRFMARLRCWCGLDGSSRALGRCVGGPDHRKGS